MFIAMRRLSLASACLLFMSCEDNTGRQADDKTNETKQQEKAPHADDPAAREIRGKLSQAAGMPLDELVPPYLLRHVLPVGLPDSKPLSVVMLVMMADAVDATAKSLEAEYSVLDREPDHAEVERAMLLSKERGYASVIQPELIDEFSCEIDGNTAKGSVRFRVTEGVAARVQFVAKRRGNAWHIEEFHLPAWKTKTVLAEGKWIASGQGVKFPVILPTVSYARPLNLDRPRVLCRVDYQRDMHGCIDAPEPYFEVGEQRIEAADLAKQLGAASQAVLTTTRAKPSEVTVVVHAYQQVPCQSVEDLIRGFESLGFTHFALAVDVGERGAANKGFGPNGTGEIAYDTPGPQPPNDRSLLPKLEVRLQANENRKLKSMTLGARDLGSDDDAFNRLQDVIVRDVISGRPDDPFLDELELFFDFDSKLQFGYLMQAVATCAGKMTPTGDTILMRNLKTFQPDDTVIEELESELETQLEITDPITPIVGGVSPSPLPKSGPPTLDDLGLELDLGDAPIAGKVNSPVDGYGPALSRMTRELIQLLRKDHVNVIWMFDESESMRDDIQKIKDRVNKVYEELGLLQKSPVGQEGPKLTSQVFSFGETTHTQLATPTDDVAKVKAALDKIPIDKSGHERLFTAIGAVLTRQQAVIRKGGKTVVVVATDEAGDDDAQHLERCIKLAKTLRVPVYFFGREAVFGTRHSYFRWKEPTSQQVFRISALRGPETAAAECLQWNGFTRRYNAIPSGFGPYAQVRLARETNGIFFTMPSAAIGEQKKRYNALDLKEYRPELASREEYIKNVNLSPFRKGMVDVLQSLDPFSKTRKLTELAANEAFPLNREKSAERVQTRIKLASVNLELIVQAQQQIEKLRPHRPQESSNRWRANHDLMRAQLACYRLRLIQHVIGLDRFSRTAAKAAKDGHDEWLIRQGGKSLLVPTDDERQRLSLEDVDVESLRKTAVKLLDFVGMHHPGTPWARQAKDETTKGFGARLETRKAAPIKKPLRPVKVPKL